MYIQQSCVACQANEQYFRTCEHCVKAGERYVLTKGHAVVIPTKEPLHDIAEYEISYDSESYEEVVIACTYAVAGTIEM